VNEQDEPARKYRTIFRAAAQADLRKIDRKKASSILRKLAEIESDPYAFGTTGLVGHPDVRRLRVGDYRVAYTIDNGELIVWVIAVAHRSIAYISKRVDLTRGDPGT
jgi:mRNA interferase RelE/StbE